MKALLATLILAGSAFADITPAAFDLAAIRDTSTLETKVIQDWQPVTKVKGVKQKLELFTAGKFKGAGSSGHALSDADRAYFQSIVDDANASFVAAVKQARPQVAKEVLTDAKVYTGLQAAKLGLVDGVVSGWEEFVGLV
jgi:hypothetical protein